MYYISRQLDYLFPLYGNFHTLEKRQKRKKWRNQTNFWKLFGNAGCDLVEIWNVGYWWWKGSPQQKSSGFIQAVHYYSSCQYSHGCGVLVSWAARHTTVCLNGTTRCIVCLTCTTNLWSTVFISLVLWAWYGCRVIIYTGVPASFT